MADPEIIERILAALERGVPAEPAAIAAAVGAALADVEAALAALADYERRVTAERVEARSSSGSSAADAGCTLPAGTRLGDFVVEGELGSGAMGVVYRARQQSLSRLVALKVLPEHLARDERFAVRFRREATLAAAIRSHPHLAEVHGFVEEGGWLAFAMRLVEGPTLHEVLQQLSRAHVAPVRRTTTQHVRRCALLVRAVADALAEIHVNGLVHRDVKPSNILLEGNGKEALDGVPVLVDFGLLRPTGDSTLTNTVTLLGTPAYAAHESMLGQGIDARADVFSLGATLHDLLTLTSPGTRGPATAGLLDARVINPTVDARLAAIVAMALQPDKALRYEHGGALRDELDRYLRQEPIRALPSGSWGRLRLWIRRDRARAAWSGAIAIVALVAIIGIAVMTTAVWDVSRTAAAATQRERDGDLLGAVEAYATLRASRVATFLPWLADDLERSDTYHDVGAPLGAIIRKVRSALDSDAARLTPPEALAPELRLAHDRLLQLLFNPSHARIQERIRSFLLQEVRAEAMRERRLAALDTWTWYLIAKGAEQTRDPELLAALLAIVTGRSESVDDELVAAATAALGAMRTAAAFTALVALLDRGAPAEASRLAGHCSFCLFGWLFRDHRQAQFEGLEAPLIERWGSAAARRFPRFEGQVDGIAGQIAFWELRVGNAAGLLALPTVMRDLVDKHKQELTASGQLGPYGNDLDRTLWCQAGPAVTLAVREDGGGASVQKSRLWFMRSETTPHGDVLPPRCCIEGTIRGTTCVGGAVRDGDGPQQDAYLRLNRPGQSRLSIVADVPAGAIKVDIRVRHLIGSRPVLRGQGTVFFSLTLMGLSESGRRTMLPGTYSSLCNNPTLGGSDAAVTASVTIPIQALLGHDSVELVYEYVRGDTTHRILGVELNWSK